MLQMARDFVKKEDVENHKLQTICKAVYPEKTFRFHQAIDDVRATCTHHDENLSEITSTMEKSKQITKDNAG